MGFEKLAELKKQFAAEAKAESAKQPRKKPVKHQAAPVDPVILAIGRLQKLFPQTFPKNPAPKVPLKIGIYDDLLAQAETIGLKSDELKQAIQTWCRSRRYWASIVEGAARLDLAGQPAGTVSSNEAAQARALERRQRARHHKQAAS